MQIDEQELLLIHDINSEFLGQEKDLKLEGTKVKKLIL